jgi:hypothetical protein
MDITHAFSFDHCAIKTDANLLKKEGFPIQFVGNSTNLRTVLDETIGRVVLEQQTNTNSPNSGRINIELNQLVNEHYGPCDQLYFMYRMRKMSPFNHYVYGKSLHLYSPANSVNTLIWGDVDFSEWVTNNDYAVYQVCYDRVTNKIYRRIDGLDLTPLSVTPDVDISGNQDINLSIVAYGTAGNTVTRITDLVIGGGNGGVDFKAPFTVTPVDIKTVTSSVGVTVSEGDAKTVIETPMVSAVDTLFVEIPENEQLTVVVDETQLGGSSLLQISGSGYRDSGISNRLQGELFNDGVSKGVTQKELLPTEYVGKIMGYLTKVDQPMSPSIVFTSVL